MEETLQTTDQIVDQVTDKDQVQQTNVQVSTPDPKVVEEIQKKSFGHAFGLIDNKLAELGYAKPDGMKTTDFIVDLITKKGSDQGTKQVDKSVDDSELGAKVKSLQDMLRQKETELEQVRSSVSVQKRDYWLESLVSSANITAPEYLSEQEKGRMMARTKNLIKSELLTNYDIKEVDGQFRFYSKDGSPILDGTIEMNPISPSSLLEREFSEFLKQPAKQQPPAVKGTGATDTKQDDIERVIPSKVKTASDFYNYLREDLKLTFGSKEFMQKLGLAKKERPSMFT